MTSDISAAILVDDSMIYGVGHYAGEIGHVTVSRNGPVCRCGKQGCLESMISVEVLRKRMAGKNAERSSILSAAGSHLGDALSMTVNMLDIHDIVVFGPADIVNDAFLDALKQSLEEQSPPHLPHDFRIRRSECGRNILIRGLSVAVSQTMVQRLKP